MGQALSVEDLLDSYRTMKTIREFEDRVHIEFTKGGIPGFVHLYAGEEASAAGVGMQLRDDDRVASNHRGHGHCIAKGVEVKGMMAEIYGKKTGICHGKGGSMHIADLDTGMMGANGIVGGGPPLACGAALAAKMKGTGGLAVVFAGDGASNQGTTFEAMNLASVWKLPVVFVFENNGYAEATASKYSVSCENISERAAGFGMPGKNYRRPRFLRRTRSVRGSCPARPLRRRTELDRAQARPFLRPLRRRQPELPSQGRGQ